MMAVVSSAGGCVLKLSSSFLDAVISVFIRINPERCPIAMHIGEPLDTGVERAKTVFVIFNLAMQPMFVTVCEGPNLDYYRSLLGDERVKRTHTYRWILNEEILVSGVSDTPVTIVNPLGGISALVNHPLKEQRVDIYEAIEVFTINGKKIGFEEDIKGNVEPGKLADFIVLSNDLYRVLKETIGDIKVAIAIVGGKVVYQR